MTAEISLIDMMKADLRQGGIFIAFIAIAALFWVFNPDAFLSSGNLTNTVLQYSYILILAIGMLFVIVLAQIDLSIGSIVAMTGALSGVLVIKQGYPWWVGVVAALVMGILIGALQGFWVTYVGIPGPIVTLAGMLLFRGLTYQVLDNVSLSPFPKGYYNIANGFLNGLPGGNGSDVFTLVIFGVGVAGFAYQQVCTRRARISYNQAVEAMWLSITKIMLTAVVVMWFAYKLSTECGPPIVLILLVIPAPVFGTLASSTMFGCDVYAIGGNKFTIALSGIDVKKVTFWCYVNMDFLADVTGVVYSVRMNGTQPPTGNMFELDAIAACFIGSAPTTGSIRRLSGALIGGLIMTVMSNGIQLMGASTSTQQIVKGAVLLLAVAFDVWNKQRTSA